MDNTKEKLTPGQLVLVICGVVFIVAAVFVGYSGFTGLFGAEMIEILYPLCWILMMVANILLACANWKKKKAFSTVQIGMWCFFLGVFASALIFALRK